MDALKKSLARVQAGEGFDRADDDAGGGLDGLTRDELYERAQKEDVAGRSSMSRRELIEALSE